MKKKIEIELTEKEAGHLRTLLEGGIKISDSISQGEVFKNILDHLNSQDQEEVMWETSEIELEEGMVIDTPGGKRKIGKTYTSKDTPEETESDVQEWEEEWQSTPVYNQISFIKNLLKEREREVLEQVLKESDKRGHYYDEDTEYEVIKEMLDKLKDKK